MGNRQMVRNRKVVFMEQERWVDKQSSRNKDRVSKEGSGRVGTGRERSEVHQITEM